MKILLIIILTLTSLSSFAYENLIAQGSIKTDPSGICQSGYIFEGINFENKLPVKLCVDEVSSTYTGPILGQMIEGLNEVDREEVYDNFLNYLTKLKTVFIEGVVNPSKTFLILSIEFVPE
jgi:hypothetical protein